MGMLNKPKKGTHHWKFGVKPLEHLTKMIVSAFPGQEFACDND